MLFPFFKGKAVFFFLSSLLHLTQCEVVWWLTPRAYVLLYASPCFAFGSKDSVKTNVNYQFLVLKIHEARRFFPLIWSKQEPASLRPHTVQPCSDVSGFEFLQTSASCKRPYLAMKQSAKMPGKEHYNLEHSSLECSRFLIRQKLDGWMFFQRRPVERNIV